jgi:hypothetical protein
MQLQIGPCRLADEHGTHEPGDVLTSASPSLIKLAQRAQEGDATACDPATGLPYVVDLDQAPKPEPTVSVEAAPAAETPEESA